MVRHYYKCKRIVIFSYKSLDRQAFVCYTISRKRGNKTMKKQYQVTLMCDNCKYKPVSTIVTMEETNDKKTIMREGQRKIMIQRCWSITDLKKYGYTKGKVREYDREKIERENAERYERIKEEKYASGEWKRPKGKATK